MDNGFSRTSGNHMVIDEDTHEVLRCKYCDGVLDCEGYCINEDCDHMKNDIDEDCDISIRGDR